jgi:hypothetical protein
VTDKPITYASRPIRPEVRRALEGLRPGQRIRITQTVRVGVQTWPAVVTGTFRHVDSLATGLATDRVPEDEIVVPIIHFTKDNGELSSVAVDENTVVEPVDDRHLPEPKPLEAARTPPTDGPQKLPATPPAEQG